MVPKTFTEVLLGNISDCKVCSSASLNSCQKRSEEVRRGPHVHEPTESSWEKNHTVRAIYDDLTWPR